MRFEKLLLAAAALCLVCMTPACSDDDPATDPEQNETPGTPGEGTRGTRYSRHTRID